MQSPPPPPPPGYPPPPSGYPPPPPPPPPSGGYPQIPPPGHGYGYASQPAYGGFWIRVVAYVIDFVILSIAGFGVGLILAVILLVTNPGDPQQAADRLRPVTNIIGLALSVGYFAGLWAYTGSTFGQRIFRLRVVDANTGQPIGAGKALVRYLGLFISFLACFMGVIWVAFDGRKQGWADKIARTVVLQG